LGFGVLIQWGFLHGPNFRALVGDRTIDGHEATAAPGSIESLPYHLTITIAGQFIDALQPEQKV